MSHVGTSRTIWAGLFLAFLTMPMVGQRADRVNTGGILGYLDARTGTFRPLPQSLPESEDLAAALTTVTGKIVTVFTITVDSAIPSTDKIQCSVNAELVDTGSGNVIAESAAVAATRSGSTATCTVTIPYSWSLASATTDKVQITYSILAPAAGSSATAALPERVSSQTVAVISVPKTGTTTNETVTATI